MASQKLQCPNCGKDARSEDINVQELVAKCMGCNHVFRFDSDDLPTDGRPSGQRKSLGREPSRPSGITIEEGNFGDLLIKRRWFHVSYFFMLFFCIAWDSFLFFWYASALNGNPGNGMDLMAIIFPIAHVAVGVGLTYYVFAGFLNTTTIHLQDEQLTVRHGPVPWFGKRDLRTDEIESVELEFNYSSNNGPTAGAFHFSVCVQDTDGKQIPLAKGLKTNQAQYIAWQVANHLDVELIEE